MEWKGREINDEIVSKILLFENRLRKKKVFSVGQFFERNSKQSTKIYGWNFLLIIFLTLSKTNHAFSIDGKNLIPASDKIFINATSLFQPMR